MEKGQPCYIRMRKRHYLYWTIGEFGVVIALVILGYLQTGSKMNLMTVFAVVGCLPASKMLVEYITMAPYQGIIPARYYDIETRAKLLTKIYELILTGDDKVMPIDAIVISEHMVCGYASNQKTDEVQAAEYIKEMLQKNHVEKVTVKIFHDYTAFLSRAEGMNNIATVENPDSKKTEEKIKQLILSTAM